MYIFIFLNSKSFSTLAALMSQEKLIFIGAKYCFAVMLTANLRLIMIFYNFRQKPIQFKVNIRNLL